VSLVLDAGATAIATFTPPAHGFPVTTAKTLRIDHGEAVVRVGPDASTGVSAQII
jgi:hypothetical protein